MENNKCWLGWGGTGAFMVSGIVKLCAHFGKVWWFLKMLNIKSPSDSATPLLDQTKWTYNHRKTGSHIVLAALFIIAKKCTLPKCRHLINGKTQCALSIQRNIIQHQKVKKYWNIRSYGWTFRTCWVEDVSYKRPCTVYSHLYEMTRMTRNEKKFR